MKPCPDRKRQLVAWIAGCAGRRDAEDIRRHIRSCLECADAADRLRGRAAGLDAAVRDLVRGDGPSAGFEERLSAAVRRLPEPRPRRWTAAVAVPAAAAVLVLAALAAAFLWSHRSGRNGIGDTIVEMSDWRAPSDWLLVSVSDELLESETVIDEYYFSLDVESTDPQGGGS